MSDHRDESETLRPATPHGCQHGLLRDACYECQATDLRAELEAMTLEAMTKERDEARDRVNELLPEADALQHFSTRALRAEAELNDADRAFLEEHEALKAVERASLVIKDELDHHRWCEDGDHSEDAVNGLYSALAALDALRAKKVSR